MFFAFVGFCIACFAVVLFLTFQFMHNGASDASADVVFEVLPGQGMKLVSQRLEAKGLVKNAWLFAFYAKMTGESSKLKRGEYQLNTSMTPDQIMAVVTSGKSIFRNLTFAEGLTVFDVAEILAKAGYGNYADNLALMYNQDLIKSLLGEPQESLEGYLFPETYQVTKFDSPKQILTQMVNRFLTVWKDYENLAQLAQWTRHQTVIFASIVEKETGAKSDRPLVSSVFHNRLKKNMRLQTDPTVLYGLAVIQKKMPNNITRADLITPTPYNTYTNAGLPPTAISNPGRDAFEATFKPAQTNYLYFVSRNDGTTSFSENLIDHNKAVQTFQLRPKDRSGKSWRDLHESHRANTGTMNNGPEKPGSVLSKPTNMAKPPIGKPIAPETKTRPPAQKSVKDVNN
jgi:UPF0755 protein